MKKQILKILLLFLTMSTALGFSNNAKSATLHDFVLKDIDGQSIDLKDFYGKPVFIVNTASKCGFTPQYGELQKLYKEFENDGVIFIGVPSNDFRQELNTNEEVKKFCLIKFGISFYLTEIEKIKGDTAHPLFKWLAETHKVEPKWNFYKYLFDKEGRLVNSWSSITSPTSKKIKKSIKKLL